MCVYQENLKHKSLLSCTRINQLRGDNKKNYVMIFFNKNKLLNHAFHNKTEQKNKVQGSLETLRLKTLY